MLRARFPWAVLAVVLLIVGGIASTFDLSKWPAASSSAADAPPVDKPTLTLTAVDPEASEKGSDTGLFVVTRTGDLTAELKVHYVVAGTATNGRDYQQLSGIVTFQPREMNAFIKIIPLTDDKPEEKETVILTLVETPGYQRINPTATVFIVDGDDGRHSFGPGAGSGKAALKAGSLPWFHG